MHNLQLIHDKLFIFGYRKPSEFLFIVMHPWGHICEQALHPQHSLGSSSICMDISIKFVFDKFVESDWGAYNEREYCCCVF